MGLILLLLVITGCAASGPLVKPDRGSRQEYVSKKPWLDEEIKRAILKGKVIEGMTKEDVRVTWGEPTDISYSKDPIMKDFEYWYYKGTLLQTLAPNCTITFSRGRVGEVYCGGWLEK